MIKRITGYHINNNPDKAWDIINNEIGCTTTDIYLIGQNFSALGEIPAVTRLRLENLIKTAEEVLEINKRR
jgi:hypothetical protein